MRAAALTSAEDCKQPVQHGPLWEASPKQAKRARHREGADTADWGGSGIIHRSTPPHPLPP